MKLHEQSEVEELVAVDSDAESDVDAPLHKKRRGGDVGRVHAGPFAGGGTVSVSCGREIRRLWGWPTPAAAIRADLWLTKG